MRKVHEIPNYNITMGSKLDIPPAQISNFFNKFSTSESQKKVVGTFMMNGAQNSKLFCTFLTYYVPYKIK